MDPTRELIDALHDEELERARRMTPSQKLAAGGDLFDAACEWTLAGIRRENPGITETEARAELRRRLAQARQLEDQP